MTNLTLTNVIKTFLKILLYYLYLAPSNKYIFLLFYYLWYQTSLPSPYEPYFNTLLATALGFIALDRASVFCALGYRMLSFRHNDTGILYGWMFWRQDADTVKWIFNPKMPLTIFQTGSLRLSVNGEINAITNEFTIE